MTVHRRCPRCEGGPMHVGLAAVFQNPKKARSDIDVYRNELRLAAEAEPLGFESVWGVEHHFTDYTMCPDVLQFLTYMRSEEHTSELQSLTNLVCRLLLEKKKHMLKIDDRPTPH